MLGKKIAGLETLASHSSRRQARCLVSLLLQLCCLKEIPVSTSTAILCQT